MFVFEFIAVNVLLPLLPEQPFHLVVCESEESSGRAEKWSQVLVVNSSGSLDLQALAAVHRSSKETYQ